MGETAILSLVDCEDVTLRKQLSEAGDKQEDMVCQCLRSLNHIARVMNQIGGTCGVTLHKQPG